MPGTGKRSLRCSSERLTTVAVRTAVITLTALAVAAARPGYGQTPSSPAAAAAGPPRVVLLNASPQRVKVEVRVGPSESCDEHPLVAVRTLHRGRRWAVRTMETVCWRREQVPGDPSGAWTAWSTRTVGTQPVYVERVM